MSRRLSFARLVVLIGLAALLLAALVHVPPTRTFLRGRVEAWMARHGVVARVEGLDYNAFTLTVRIARATFAAAEHPGAPFAEIEGLRIALSWGAVTGPLSLQAATATRVTLRFTRAAGGEWNIPVSRGGPPTSTTLKIAQLRIAQLDLHVDDREADFRLDVDKARLELGPTPGAARGPLYLPAIIPFTVAGQPYLLREGRARVAYDGADVVVEALTSDVMGVVAPAGPSPPAAAASLRSPSTPSPLVGTVQIAGRIASVLDRATLDLQGEARIDLEGLARTLSLSGAPSGRLTTAIRVDGPAVEPRARLDTRTPILRWYGADWRDAVASAELTSRQLDVSAIRASVAGGSVTSSMRVGVEGDAPPGELSAEWRNVLVATVLQMAGVETAAVPAGRAAGRLAAQWRAGALPSLDLTASSDIAAGPVRAGTLPVAGSIGLRVKHGRWSLEHRLTAGTALDVSGRYAGELRETIADSTLDGEMSLATADLRSLARDAQGTVVAARPEIVRDLDGTAQGTVHVSGRVGDPVFRAEIGSDRISFGGLGRGAVSIEAQGDLSRVRLGRVRADLDRLHASLTGDADLARDQLALVFTLATDSLPALSDAAPAIARAGVTAGSLSIEGTIEGRLRRPRVSASVNGQRFMAAGQRVDSLSGRVILDVHGAEVERLELGQCAASAVMPCEATGTLALGGRYDWASGRLALEAHGRNIAVAPLPSGIAGKAPVAVSGLIASLAIDAAGSPDRLVGNGKADLVGATWDGYRVGPGRIEAVLDGESVRLTASAPLAGVSARADVAQRAPWPFTLEVDLKSEDVRALSGGLFDVPDDLALTLASSLSARGELSAPERTTASLTVSSIDGRARGVVFSLVSPSRTDWRPDRLEIGDTQLRMGGLTLRAAGTLAERDSRLAVAVGGGLADLAPFIALSGAAPIEESEGRLDGRLDVTGPWSQLDLSGGFSVVDGRARLRGVPDVTGIQVRATLANGSIALDRASAGWQDAVVDAHGVLPLTVLSSLLPSAWLDRLRPAAGPAELSATFDNVTTRTVEPFLAPEIAANLSARVSGEIEMTSDDLTLPRTRGVLTLKDASFAFTGIPLAQTRPTRLDLADGRLRVTTAEFANQGNRLFVTGGVALAGPRGPRFDLAADATLDLRLPGAFLSDMATGGIGDVSISLSGPLSAPNIDGQVVVRNGELRLRDPRVAITSVEGTMLLARDEVRIDQMKGLANGGPVSLSGGARFTGLGIDSGRFLATGKGIALEWPPGLRSESDGEVTLAFDGPALPPRLSGRVIVQRGAYKDPLSLVALARYAATPSPVVPDPTLLDRMRLDVAVTSADDLVFDNNYGRFESGLDLKVGGTFLQPTLNGRVALREGGQIFLGGNLLRIDRGVVGFTPSARITPEFDILTRTRVSGYDLTVTLSGPPENLKVDLACESEPSLSDADIASLLVSGQKAGRTAESQVAREQVISLFSGELLNLAGRAVGLDSVRFDRGALAEDLRFDPSLVATEVDPSARITVSKRLGTDVEVIASSSIRESGQLTWIIRYSPRGWFDLRAIARDNDERSYEITQERSFGRRRSGTPAPSKAPPVPRPRVADVVFDGDDGTDTAELRKRLRVREGKPFDFYGWQEDRDRLLEFYHRRDHLEARVDARREVVDPAGTEPQVRLRYTVTRGPRTEIVVNGARLDDRVVRSMRATWVAAVFDGFLADDLAQRARLTMLRSGFLRADVTARVVASTDRQTKRVVIDVTPNAKSERRRIVVQGNATVSRGDLDEAVALAGVRERMWITPELASVAMAQACVRAGLLDAAVEAEGPVFADSEATLTFKVAEGPRYRLVLAAVDGEQAIDEAEVRSAAQVEADAAYTPATLDALLMRVERLYRRGGFNGVRVQARPTVRRGEGRVDIALEIEEGPRQVLAGIDVSGAERTQKRVVERAIDLRAGEPANLDEWSKAQRRLYDAGVFRLADIQAEPVGPAVPAANGRGLEQPVRATVRLEEWPSLRVRYGVLLSDSPGADGEPRNRVPGLVGELQQRNLFGRAASAGLAGRYERDFRVGRAYIAAPRLFGLPLLSNAYVAFDRRALNEEGALPFVDARQTAGAEQRLRLGIPLELSWNLNLERSRVYALDPDPDDPFPLDLTVTIARVATALAYDRRNDPFDTTRGWLHTANVEYAATALGDESLFGGARFVKYTGQQFIFVPVWRGVVLASAVRVGIANGFRQGLVPSERFRLGGSTTVRGYATESLGPRDVFGDALGGEALLVLNQEVRFPIFKWLRGVAFVDAGNVFERPRAIDLGALDVGAGGGLRFTTPYVLIRVDYGVPLARGFGFRSGRWYFSVGQAF